MDAFGTAAFSARTGLSAKALRLYEERGLLCPASVDPVSGYRRYTHVEVTKAGRIALLRRAGIALADIGRFLTAPDRSTIDAWISAVDIERNERRNALEALAESLGLRQPREGTNAMTVTIRSVDSAVELAAVFDVAGAQFDPPIDHSDEARFGDLQTALADQRELLLVAEAAGEVVGAALGFIADGQNATLRILGVVSSHRQQGVGASLLRSFERGVRRLGGDTVSLGADETAGFYVRQGYRTLLLLQWVYDAARFEDEFTALLDGPLQGMESSRSSFDGVPQLFVNLDEPSPNVRAEVIDLVHGAHVGYCMTRQLQGVSDSDRGR